MSSVQAYKAATKTTDTATAELLALTVGEPSLDTATVETLARAIDTGRFARSAATPDHRPAGLALPAEVLDRIAGMFELARRAGAAPPPTVIRSPADVLAIARRELGGRNRECVLVIVCDAANVVIGEEIVSRGALDRALLPVREILVTVLRLDGRAFAVAHNHPGCALRASDADARVTDDLALASRRVGLRFLGHVIVDGGVLESAHAAKRAKV